MTSSLTSSEAQIAWFVVAACNAETYSFTAFVSHAGTKSTKFGSRYLGEGSLERDEILQVARGD